MDCWSKDLQTSHINISQNVQVQFQNWEPHFLYSFCLSYFRSLKVSWDFSWWNPGMVVLLAVIYQHKDVNPMVWGSSKLVCEPGPPSALVSFLLPESKSVFLLFQGHFLYLFQMEELITLLSFSSSLKFSWGGHRLWGAVKPPFGQSNK